MDFGFTLKLENETGRTLDLTRRAEAAGFAYGWVFDSHVLWRDPYPALTLMAGVTERMRLGTCVTNPATREPSVTASTLAELQEISSGRMDLGIGRGDLLQKRAIGFGVDRDPRLLGQMLVTLELDRACGGDARRDLA